MVARDRVLAAAQLALPLAAAIAAFGQVRHGGQVVGPGLPPQPWVLRTCPAVAPSRILRRVPSVSPQVQLALGALRALAGAASGLPVERLASAMDTPPDRLLEVLGPLQHAGWVRREEGASDVVHFLHPVPPPTLQELIEAIEGATPIDDCVLHPGASCGALRSAPVCGQHHAWTRQLTSSALAATVLVGTGAWARPIPGVPHLAPAPDLSTAPLPAPNGPAPGIPTVSARVVEDPEDGLPAPAPAADLPADRPNLPAPGAVPPTDGERIPC